MRKTYFVTKSVYCTKNAFYDEIVLYKETKVFYDEICILYKHQMPFLTISVYCTKTNVSYDEISVLYKETSVSSNGRHYDLKMFKPKKNLEFFRLKF